MEMTYERYLKPKDHLCSMPPLVEVSGYGGPWGWFVVSKVGTFALFGGGDLSTTSVFTYASNSAVAGGNLSYAAYSLAACSANPGVNY